jgi:hypothetical protein
MAICGNCKSETSRVRTKFTHGQSVDECPHCAPLSFERQQNPSEKKIWMGWEYMPNMYKKKYDKDGLIYEAKDELTQDTEDQIARGSKEDLELAERAIEKKRVEGRKAPLIEGTMEYQQIKQRADEMIASALKVAEAERVLAQKAQEEEFVRSRLPLEYMN